MTATWKVVYVDRVIDGDTIVVVRERSVGQVDGYRLTARDTEPVPVRLIHVDTPERGEIAWGEAKRDLELWVQHHPFLIIKSAGVDNFGRHLGDVVDEQTGESASLHLIAEKGWPTWQETRKS